MITPTFITCDECGRSVPVAPHYSHVAVPHVWDGTKSVDKPHGPALCHGNTRRQWRDDLTHPAERLALQHHILDTDEYWEGL